MSILKIFMTVLVSHVVFTSVRGQDNPAIKGSVDRGKMIYEQNCLACHQADGSGVPNLAPPLIKGQFVGGAKEKVISILLEGLSGVEIKGEYYANPMPAFGYLGDEEIADVLTYVRSNFSNNGAAIVPDDVAAVRKGQSPE